jgi:hypothetical protein
VLSGDLGPYDSAYDALGSRTGLTAETYFQALAVHHDSVQAAQIVWTDSADRLPWEPGYANPPGPQPLLGSP